MKTYQVGCAVIHHQGKLLISKRLPGTFLEGYWEFPGGKMEEGESAPDCLVREAREELDIVIEVGNCLRISRHEYPEKIVVLHFYLCEWKERDPKALECAEFAWIEPKQLLDYQFPKGDESLIEELIEKSAEYFGSK